MENIKIEHEKLMLAALKEVKEYFVTYDGIDVMKLTKLLIKINLAIYSAEAVK